MELYTSLTRLKMAMNGGELPPMTELKERTQAFLDPRFTPGMGCLEEDEKRGLRCPVRGCGNYYHNLGKHLSAAHYDVGGAPAIKALLDISQNVSLSTKRARAINSMRHLNRHSDPTAIEARRNGIKKRMRNGGIRRDGRLSIHAKNLRDRCEAQLRTKLDALRLELGWTPSRTEFSEKYSRSLGDHIARIYGTWNEFLVQMGYREIDKRRLRRQVSQRTHIPL